MTDSSPARIGAAIPLLGAIPEHLAHLVPIATAQQQPSAQFLAEADASERAADAEAEQQIRAAQRAYRTRIWRQSCPAKFRAAELGGLDPADQDPNGLVSGWLDSGVQTLMLAGDLSRRGKSHAACAVGHAALEAGMWVVRYRVTDLLHDMRPSQTDPARAEDTRDLVQKVDLLILDDLGVEKRNDWPIEVITDVLDYRITADQRMVITTNLASWAALCDQYGDRVVGRLNESALVVPYRGRERTPDGNGF